MKMRKGNSLKERKVKVGIYVRVSTDEQVNEGYSIDAQIRKAQVYMDLFDLKVESTTIYKDEGKSAKSLKRKGLQELIKDVENEKINTVIINKLDRLSRNVLDIYSLLEFFLDYDCDLISVNDNLDIRSANGRVLVGILAVIAQWEREVIAERTYEAILEMIAENMYPFANAPYGCNKDENNKLSINIEEQEILNKMVDLLIDGMPLEAVCRKLSEDYKRDLPYEKFRVYLRKNSVCGELKYKDVVYKNVIPVIVEKRRLLLAREMIAKRKTKNQTEGYYFRNKVRCTCGKLCVNESTIKKEKKYFYYKCPSCHQRINQDKLLDQTLYSIISSFKENDKLKHEKRIYNGIERINKKIITANDNFNNGIMDVVSFTGIMYRLENDRNKLIKKADLYSKKEIINWVNMTDKEKSLFIEEQVSYVVVHTPLKMVAELKLK